METYRLVSYLAINLIGKKVVSTADCQGTTFEVGTHFKIPIGIMDVPIDDFLTCRGKGESVCFIQGVQLHIGNDGKQWVVLGIVLDCLRTGIASTI